MGELAIKVDHINKVYKLYENPMDRLKEALKLTSRKCYTEYYALNDISFHVDRGESVALVGTNGAGKSTLLKIITGVLTPTKGELQINGKISALLELGAGFNMEYTGLENIYLNGSMMGYTREEMETRVERIVEFAGIGDFIHQPVKTYSSGMFARLAFAVAINVEPDILIVDEALSVGDIYFQAKCFKKMDEIKAKGTTILLVTHDMSSVIKYCDRAILLNKGSFVAEGNPKEIVDLYKKVLVNQLDVKEEPKEEVEENTPIVEGTLWRNKLPNNEQKLTYGNGKASIVDFGIFDYEDKLTNILLKKKECTIKMKVQFNETVEGPIFAYTFKNAKGVEITGTNTLFEGKTVELAKAGETYVIEFKQDMLLQGGEYLLSFGCTGYVGDEFEVYDRLYDVTNVIVVSEQNTVGYYDMNSKINISVE